MTTVPTTTPTVGLALDTALADLRARALALAEQVDGVIDHLNNLSELVAGLDARVDRLEVEADPEPDPDPEPEPEPEPPPPPPPPPVEVWRDTDLWTGPTWTGPFPADPLRLYQPASGLTPWRTPSIKTAANQNPARLAPLTPGGLDVILHPADRTKQFALASTIHEGWLPFDRRYTEAGFETDLMLPTGWSWPKTMKWGGIVGWDGDWNTWPGGGRYSGRNASARLTGWHYDRARQPLLAAYLYLGGQWDPAKAEVWGTSGANYVSNDSHSVEFLLDAYGVPPMGQWITARFDVACGTDGVGSLQVELDGEVVLVVDGLPWFTDRTTVGWNMGYLCAGFGGDTPDYLPTSPAPWHMYHRRSRWYSRAVVG